MQMHKRLCSVGKDLLIVTLILLLIPFVVSAQDEAPPAPEQKGLQQRIDFGNAQILGQSIKSGAVYLMHRKKSDIKNMLEVRQNYRNEIIEEYGLEKTAIPEREAEQPKKQPKTN
jgi:hypothetical protein